MGNPCRGARWTMAKRQDGLNAPAGALVVVETRYLVQFSSGRNDILRAGILFFGRQSSTRKGAKFA